MKIAKIEISRMKIPLRTPFVTAIRRVEAIEDIVVMISTDDGRTGFGEAPPTAAITGDTIESIVATIKKTAPLLIGKNILDFNDILRILHAATKNNPSPKAALEIALFDLWAQNLNLPLHKALGGGTDLLKTDLTISINPVEQMVNDALNAVARGFDHLKIKVGKNAVEDIARLTAIQEAVSVNVKLSVDANQGWSVIEAVESMRKLEAAGLNFDYLEQPVKAADLDGLKTVAKSIKTPVLADESVFSPFDAIKLLELDAADIINIKLMKSAGISNAIKIAAITELYGKECMIGCMLEGPVSVAAAACFAASQKCVTRFDLDGPMLAEYSPVSGGTVFDGPNIILPNSPGLGITHIDDLEVLKEIF